MEILGVIIAALGYVMVGVLISTINDRLTGSSWDSGAFVCMMFLWPVAVAMLVVLFIFWIPYKLANIVCDFIEKRKDD